MWLDDQRVANPDSPQKRVSMLLDRAHRLIDFETGTPLNVMMSTPTIQMWT